MWIDAIDLETGAAVAVTVRDADDGDTETSIETLLKRPSRSEAVRPAGDGLEEVVGNEKYHTNQSLVDRCCSNCAAACEPELLTRDGFSRYC